jgi:hypothetical protein
MDDEIPQARTLALMVLLALWCSAWVYSIVFFVDAGLTGDGINRGLDRISGFLGWQGVAGMLAFAVWGVGLGFPKGSPIRKTSAVPLGMALALILLIIGFVIWGRFSRP